MKSWKEKAEAKEEDWGEGEELVEGEEKEEEVESCQEGQEDPAESKRRKKEETGGIARLRPVYARDQ